MRFPLAALLFLVASFIFFIIWAVCTYMLSAVSDAMNPLSSMLSAEGATSFTGMLDLLSVAFGIISVILFVAGILLFFFLESVSDEPEYYRRY